MKKKMISFDIERLKKFEFDNLLVITGGKVDPTVGDGDDDDDDGWP